MSEAINITVKRRKKRVVLTSRQREQLERAKRRLLEVQQRVLWDRPSAEDAVLPKSAEVKACKELTEEFIALISPQLSGATITEKKRWLKVFVDWLGPRNLSRELVEKFVSELHAMDESKGWSDGTKWVVGANLVSFLNWLWDGRRIETDYRKGIRFPKKPAQKPRPVYTADEIKLLVEAAGDRPIGFLILLAYHTGMAIVDCANLCWGSVDMEKLTITKPRQKTGVEAICTIKFGSELHQRLLKQQEETIRAFGSILPGFPVCKDAFSNKHSQYTLHRRLCEQVGIPYRSFHSFRATLITDLTTANVPLNVGLKIAGLRSVQQYASYSTAPVTAVREHMEKLRA